MSFIIVPRHPNLTAPRMWAAWVTRKDKNGDLYHVPLVRGATGPGNVYRRLYASHRDLSDIAEIGVW